MTEIGRPTYYSRVERWECDYNNHWNARFYGRSFQMAAEALATTPGAPGPGGAITPLRHLRFHRELFVSAPVEVRSARLAGGPQDGAVVHLLMSGGEISATALDLTPQPAADLPEVTPEEVPLALPRGLGTTPMRDWPDAGAHDVTVPLGPVRPSDLDHTGALLFEQIIRHSSVSSHAQLNHLGFTPEFSNRTGINRMGVEFLVSRGAAPLAGRPLFATSRLQAIKGKSFWAVHRVIDDMGEAVATIEQCLLTVDLNTRKAVAVPEFLYAALD